MPGPVTPNMSLQLPALGGDSGTWDSEVNNAFTSVDSHTHEPGKGVLVPTAGLNINADLSLGGNGLTNIKSLTFSEIAALAAGSDVIFVNSSDHELYWRSHSGVNVKLTSGNALNVAAFAGGIGGDYSAVGAALDYDAANTRYTFQGASPTFDWAILASGDLRLYQAATTESVYTGIQVAPSLVASYNIVLPTALPSAIRPLFMGSDGTLSTATGCLAARQVFTSSGTYTPTAGIKSILVRMIGGGGGGGGAATGTGGACGGGGGSGEYWEKWIDSVTTGGAVTIGTAGAGATAGNNAGGNGADTTVVVNSTTYTAKAGLGGSGEASESVGSAAGGGIQTGSTADVQFAESGMRGWNARSAVDLGFSGRGGSTSLGAGGPSQGGSMASTGTSVANGASGTGYGSGGSGGFSGNSSGDASGGAGRPGIVIIDEFM